MLYKFLKKFNPVLVNGNVDPKVRQCEIDIFQNDDKCKVILGTYRTLGVGYNLTAARRVEHFDNPWSMTTKNQANDRAHRIGTTGVININTMLCRDTIDERIDELIENKGAICDFIIDGRIVGDRKKLLEFLLS
jgi:SNF2 family DNA or RNA helicase